MAECIAKLEEKILPVFEFSGKGFMQVGNYPDCQEADGLIYNFVNFAAINTTNPAANVGLCLPSECDNETVKLALDAAVKTTPLHLYVLSVDNRVEQYFYEYDWVFYLMSLITVASVFLVVYASIEKPKNKLSAFSVQETLKLFKSNPNSSLNVLNGVRSLAMMWVVLGHCMFFSLRETINVQTVEQSTVLRPIFLVIEAGLFAVDVFFYVGGLLVAYVVLKDASRNNLKYLVAIFQRFLRFWPSYLFTIMIYYSVYLHLGEGPLWGLDQSSVMFCQKIWKPFFFIDNLVENGETACLGWGWYLQNDMQLFIFSMCLLLLYSLRPMICKGTICVFIFLSILYTFVYCMNNHIKTISHLSDFGTWSIFISDVYVKPWARCPPYLLGLLGGILYHEYLIETKQAAKDSNGSFVTVGLYSKFLRLFRSNKLMRLGFEWSGILLMFFLVAIPRTLQVDIEWSQFSHSVYLSLAKFLFVLGLHLTILPSLLGCRESFVMTLMDTKPFNYIAKVSFCTYLIHLIIIHVWDYSIKTSRYYSLLNQFVVYCGILVLSLFFGALMTFMVEAPFAKLQKSFIGWIKGRVDDKSQRQKEQQPHAMSSTMNINKSLMNS